MKFSWILSRPGRGGAMQRDTGNPSPFPLRTKHPFPTPCFRLRLQTPALTLELGLGTWKTWDLMTETPYTPEHAPTAFGTVADILDHIILY